MNIVLDLRDIIEQVPYPPDPSILASHDRSERPSKISTLRPQQQSFCKSPQVHNQSLIVTNLDQSILNPQEFKSPGGKNQRSQKIGSPSPLKNAAELHCQIRKLQQLIFQLRRDNQSLRIKLAKKDELLDRLKTAKISHESSDVFNKIIQLISTNLQMSATCEWEIKNVKASIQKLFSGQKGQKQKVSVGVSTEQFQDSDRLALKRLKAICKKFLACGDKLKVIAKAPYQVELQRLTPEDTVSLFQKMARRISTSNQIKGMLGEKSQILLHSVQSNKMAKRQGIHALSVKRRLFD